MNFRYQGFNEDRELVGGWIRADNIEAARETLEEMLECVVQLTPARFALGMPDGLGPQGLSVQASEQFIPVEPPRRLVLRTGEGLREKLLIGHVEMYGGREYVQLWTCLALYILTALVLWTAFPPLREVDLRDWLSEEHQGNLGRYNSQLFKAVTLMVGNSAASLLVLLFVLAMKDSLPRIGLTVLAVYVFQWIGCSSLGRTRIEEGPGAAIHFMAQHPFYTFLAWVLPVIVIVAAERILRQVLHMTVPVYEDPETRKLETGGGRRNG